MISWPKLAIIKVFVQLSLQVCFVSAIYFCTAYNGLYMRFSFVECARFVIIETCLLKYNGPTCDTLYTQ